MKKNHFSKCLENIVQKSLQKIINSIKDLLDFSISYAISVSGITARRFILKC